MIISRFSQKSSLGTQLNKYSYFYPELVGAWLLNEGGGATAHNLVTPGLNDAVFVAASGDPAWTPSTVRGLNYGVSVVSGSHQYLDAGIITALNGVSQATIVVYFNCT